ncbi:MAG: hypothetical protein ACTSWP_01645 [Candidatus Freyarchaeota archaeon]
MGGLKAAMRHLEAAACEGRIRFATGRNRVESGYARSEVREDGCRGCREACCIRLKEVWVYITFVEDGLNDGLSRQRGGLQRR